MNQKSDDRENSNSNNIPFFPGCILLNFLFTRKAGIAFHLSWNVKRNKMYKGCTMSRTVSKFNMKHSLKTLDLQRSRRSPAERRPLRTTQTASISTTRIQELSPRSATRFPQLLTGNHGSVKHGCRTFPAQFSNPSSNKAEWTFLNIF